MSDAKWDDHNYIKAYDLAKSGFSKMKIAKALGVSWPTFRKWMKKRPALRNAILNASKSREVSQSGEFQDYIFRRLPDNLQKLWNKIHLANHPKKRASIEYIEELLKDQGKQTRQRLFLHAFAKYNFNMTEACRSLNLKPKTVENWISRDAGFHEIMQEMEKAKDDLYEGAFVQLVKNLDPGTVRMAAETRLAHRGYARKVNIKHEGEVGHKVEVVPVEELGLSADEMEKLLVKMRERKQAAITDKSDVVDAEFTVRKRSK